jgi:hypothetical protein
MLKLSNFNRSSKLELCHNVSKPYEPSSKRAEHQAIRVEQNGGHTAANHRAEHRIKPSRAAREGAQRNGGGREPFPHRVQSHPKIVRL